MLRFVIPAVFVLIWSTGFIVAKAVVPHADLQLYLVARFTLTSVVMGLAVLAVGAQWPRGRGLLSHLGTTLLMWMMRHGEATKVTALLLLAPPLAAVQAYVFFAETLSALQFVGFALALMGVLLARSARVAPR